MALLLLIVVTTYVTFLVTKILTAKRANPEDSSITLTKTQLFQWSFYGPQLLSVILAIPIFFSNTVDYSFSHDSISMLFNVYRFPLVILGLTIPFTALSAAIHRSEQTSLQIETQTIQNNFSNHFKHLEEFIKRFRTNNTDKEDHLIKKYWGKVENFHTALYPQSHQGNLKPNLSIGTINEEIEFLCSDLLGNIGLVDDVLEGISNTLKNSLKITISSPLNGDKGIGALNEILQMISLGVEFSGINKNPLTLQKFHANRNSLSDFINLRSFHRTQIRGHNLSPQEYIRKILKNQKDQDFIPNTRLSDKVRDMLLIEYWYSIDSNEQAQIKSSLNNDELMHLSTLNLISSHRSHLNL